MNNSSILVCFKKFILYSVNKIILIVVGKRRDQRIQYTLESEKMTTLSLLKSAEASMAKEIAQASAEKTEVSGEVYE